MPQLPCLKTYANSHRQHAGMHAIQAFSQWLARLVVDHVRMCQCHSVCVAGSTRPTPTATSWQAAVSKRGLASSQGGEREGGQACSGEEKVIEERGRRETGGVAHLL